MADRETKIVNFYESTTASLLASGNVSVTLTSAPTTDGSTKISATAGQTSTYYYLVVDPDNSSNREIIMVTASTNETVTALTRDIEGRYATSTTPDHQAGTTVRLAVLAQHFEDMNDRLDSGIAELNAAIVESEVGNGLIFDTTLQVDINGATDGTTLETDGDNDLLLVYDATDGSVKKFKASAVGGQTSTGLLLTFG